MFSLKQLEENALIEYEHYFVNCLKYFGNDNDIIEFTRIIIMDILPMKYLDK
ncbi:MAG: hypothetical protein Ta2E_00890 [Mycoplasmoidaceae bacterium]|nr:MAG: hypothetical protein Ta2E_00890 [Mycoplasmoidaceae bacterium]